MRNSRHNWTSPNKLAVVSLLSLISVTAYATDITDDAVTAGAAGDDINITAGDGDLTNGGNIVIQTAGSAATVDGNIILNSGNSLSLTGTNGVSITGTTAINNNLYVSGNFDVNGATTTDGITNAGTFSQTGSTAINTTGTATTTIGSASSATSIGGNLGVTGTTTTNAITNTGNLSQTGQTDINNTGTATTNIGNSNSTNTIVGTTSINTSGALTTTIGNTTANNIIQGTTAVTGVTNINTTGTATTNIGTGTGATINNIGNSNSTNSIQGATTLVGATDINTAGTATTNIGTGTGATANNIGNSNSTNTVQGTTSITGATDINVTGGATTNIATTASAATNIGTAAGSVTTIGESTDPTTVNDIYGTTGINTAGALATTIGTNGNTTNLNSSTVNIGTQAYDTTVDIGSTQTNTDITARGGNSTLNIQNNIASLMSSNNGLSTYTNGQIIGTDYTLINGNAASQALVTGQTTSNVLVGNTLVDGDMYINGTLTYTSSSSASTTVTSGVSELPGATLPTVGAFSVDNVNGMDVDENGKISTTGATGPTAGIIITNGYGNTHGLVVTESQTTLSGGTHSSSMILDNNGATFSDSNTGLPVQVHGVADGTASFDAVNYRQLREVKRGLAATTAMTNIPAIDNNKKFSVGVGVGGYDEETAFALGSSMRVKDKFVIKASVGHSFGGSTSSSNTTWGLGSSFSW